MSEITNDPMNADVGSKELTKFPLIQAGKILTFEIRKPTTAAGKKDASKNVLTIPCYTTMDTEDVEGKTLNKGFPVYMRIPVTPSEKRDASKIAGDIAKLCQAIGLKGVTVRSVIDNPREHLDGKLFSAKTRIIAESDGFPESNALSPVPLA